MRANQAQQDQAVGIRYVGVRDLHEDHLYGTRLAWLPGQVHNVDAAIAVRMLMHKDVYERADVEANKPVSGKSNQVEQEQERVQEQQLDDTRSAIAIMDKDVLHTFRGTSHVTAPTTRSPSTMRSSQACANSVRLGWFSSRVRIA